MQLSAVLNIFIVKTYLSSIFTNDLKRFFFSKNVHSYRSSLFNEYRSTNARFYLYYMTLRLFKSHFGVKSSLFCNLLSNVKYSEQDVEQTQYCKI